METPGGGCSGGGVKDPLCAAKSINSFTRASICSTSFSIEPLQPRPKLRNPSISPRMFAGALILKSPF